MKLLTINMTKSTLELTLTADNITSTTPDQKFFKDLGYQVNISDGILNLSRENIHNDNESILISRITNMIKLTNEFYRFVDK